MITFPFPTGAIIARPGPAQSPRPVIEHRRLRWLLAALALVGDASEAPEVLGVKGDLDALTCLLLQSREHPLARLPEDLDPDRRVERLGIRYSCSLGNNRNVCLHRGGVRVNLDNRNLISGFVHVLVERDQAWLVGLDEFDETRHTRPLAVKSPRFEAIRCDEDQRSLHSASLPRDFARRRHRSTPTA